MSLQTDIIFIKAINSDEDLVETLGGRIYSTAIPLPDEDLDNVPLPYAIVSYSGMANEAQTKDDPYEGETDNVHIAVEVVAKTRQELATLITTIREVIHDYFTDGHEEDEEDENLIPLDYQLTAQAVVYDPYKPGYWQVLDYQCDTYKD